MSSKLRMVLAGLTAAALIGGVMVADPADAGKKRKHKKVKVVKVKKVKKGNSVKQVSKGGDAKAGNGGNGGAGGSSGNVNNTGNVGGGPVFGPPTGPGVGVSPAALECVAADPQLIGPNPGGVYTAAEILNAITTAPAVCFATTGAVPAAFLDCLVAASLDGVLAAEVIDCGVIIPGVLITPGSSGGSVFSGNGGPGGDGGDGGAATGGNGGSNTNISTVTVSRDDHSIDVDN